MTASGSLRRAAVLALLAAALGLVAVRGVAQREAAARAQIGELGRVVVLLRDVPADHALRAGDLAYRTVPLRWAAAGALGDAEAAIGLRTAVAMPRGTPLLAATLTSPGARARDAFADGDRVLEIIATGSARLVRGGSRVDVLRSAQRGDGSSDSSVVAEDVEVVDIRPLDDAAPSGAEQVAATLRVTTAAALKLTRAQDGSAELRLLPRAPWDRRSLRESP